VRCFRSDCDGICVAAFVLPIGVAIIMFGAKIINVQRITTTDAAYAGYIFRVSDVLDPQ
jgi:hypothetical protein